MRRNRRFWIVAASAAVVVAGGVAAVIAATAGGGDHAAVTADDGMTTNGMSANGMGGHDMAPVDTSTASATPSGVRGGRLLVPDMMDGEKTFRLTASPVRWTIAPGTEVGALAYNGQVPGPLIRARAGDRLRVVVKNGMSEPTSVHWHGLVLPNAMDGAGGVTQKDIMPGESFTYRFRLRQSGTYFYHSHTAGDRQVALGLSGALIVDGDGDEPVAADVPMMLGEWTIGPDGNVAGDGVRRRPAQLVHDQREVLAKDRAHPREEGREGEDPVHRVRPVRPPHARPRGILPHRGDRREPGSHGRPALQGHGARRPGRTL